MTIFVSDINDIKPEQSQEDVSDKKEGTIFEMFVS